MRNLAGSAILLWLLGSTGVGAQAQVEVLKLEFSETADQVTSGKLNREVKTRVIHLARDGRRREEVLKADGSVLQVEIENPIEKAGYVLHPRARTAHRWTLEHQHSGEKRGITPELLGERVLQGFSCKGSRAIMPGNQHNSRKRTAEVWECKDETSGLSFLGSVEIRSEGGHSHTRNLIRVQRGVLVDGQLFEVPSGYVIHPAAAQQH